MNRDIRLAAALSVIAGVTDVTTWLLLGGFFSAHVTGNFVVMASAVVRGTYPDLTTVLSIPVFVVTSTCATVLIRRMTTLSVRGRTLTLLGAQAAFLIAAAALSFTGAASADPQAPLAVIIGAFAVCAMATQNAFLHLVPARPRSTAVMTGNLVAATVAATQVVASKGKDTAARTRWSSTWPLIAGFVVGCVLGTACVTLLRDHAAVMPAALATVLFARLALWGVPAPAPAATQKQIPAS